MATLDDKLLGEKLHYYCSSSEDEDEPEPEPQNDESSTVRLNPNEHNTGPKGVIEDWRRYKQLEVEKRKEDERERLDLAKKLSLNCRTEREDREINDEIAKLDEELEDDEFLQEYIKKRMHEMIESSIINRKQFGHVFELKDGNEFLDTVDNPEFKDVLIVIHIWDRASEPCKAINGCLQTIAKEYSYIRFCRIQASAAGLSQRFKSIGVPALLVYKSGDLIKSFVRLTDALGDDFFASDLESFLIENGVMSDAKLMPSIIKGPSREVNREDSDSD